MSSGTCSARCVAVAHAASPSASSPITRGPSLTAMSAAAGTSIPFPPPSRPALPIEPPLPPLVPAAASLPAVGRWFVPAHPITPRTTTIQPECRGAITNLRNGNVSAPVSAPSSVIAFPEARYAIRPEARGPKPEALFRPAEVVDQRQQRVARVFDHLRHLAVQRGAEGRYRRA